jgi:hypothetical protein
VFVWAIVGIGIKHAGDASLDPLSVGAFSQTDPRGRYGRAIPAPPLYIQVATLGPGREVWAIANHSIKSRIYARLTCNEERDGYCV